MTERKFAFSDKRFYVIAAILLFMWVGFMTFYYLKADEITRDPCSICSERMGEEVTCTVGDYIPKKRVYFPNGTVVDNPDEVQIIYDENRKNYSGWVINTLNITP